MNDQRRGRYASINNYRRSRSASPKNRNSSPLRFNDYDYVIDDDVYINNSNKNPFIDGPYDPNQYHYSNLPYTSSLKHQRHHSQGPTMHYSQNSYPYNNYNTEDYLYNDNGIPEDTYNPSHRFNYPPRNKDETVMDLTELPIISYPSPEPSYGHPNYQNTPNYYYNHPPIPNGFPVDEGIPMPQPNGEYRKYLYRKKTTKNILLSPEGNLIVNCSVPQRALQYALYKNSEEFLSLR